MLTARPVFDRRPFNRSPVLRGSATFVCGIERVVDTEGEGEGHVWIEIGTRTDPKGRVGRGEMDGGYEGTFDTTSARSPVVRHFGTCFPINMHVLVL